MEKRYALPKFRCDMCLELITHDTLPKELFPHSTYVDSGYLWFSEGDGKANWHTICLGCYTDGGPVPVDQRHIYKYSTKMVPTTSLRGSSAILDMFHRYSSDYYKVFKDAEASLKALEEHLGLKVYDDVEL